MAAPTVVHQRRKHQEGTGRAVEAACKTLSDDVVRRPEENVHRKLDAVEQGCWTMGAESVTLAPLTLAQSALSFDIIWKLPLLAVKDQSSPGTPEQGSSH